MTSPEKIAAAVPRHLPRRKVLAWSSGMIVGALAMGSRLPGLDIGRAFAQTPGGATSRMNAVIDLGEGDVGVLNYAYALEQLEAAFYTQVLKTPYAGIDSMARSMLTSIMHHEIAHRELFKAALKKNAIPDLEVDFAKVDFNSKESVLTTARTFEDLGVAAYNGAGQMLEKGEYLLLAGKIVSVEARHAAAIRMLIGSDRAQTVGSAGGNAEVVDDKGLDQALLPSQVLPKAAPFIKTNITADSLS